MFLFYELPFASRVSIRIYNMLGQEVATLVNGELEAGYHTVNFNGGDVASGVYFYRMEAHQTDGDQTGAYTAIKKMVLLK